MKRIFSLILIACLAIPVLAQENTGAPQQKKVKTGWKFGGALPAISFDSNLGFQYGALIEFFNYGDGSKYPDFYDHTYTEVSHFTKGSGIYRFMYESNHLIPGVNLSSDLSYLPDQANSFYGFNGYESVYNKDWIDKSSDQYKSAMFYSYQRNQFRFKNDFQGNLSGNRIQWSAGFAFEKFDIDSVDIPKLNKGKKDTLPFVADQPGLFEYYQDLGIISPDEVKGGWVNTVKIGLVYDSRDNKPNPMKGIWTEIGIDVAPGFLGNDWSFSKLFITHRQYFTLIKDDLSFAYRLGYQTTLSGHTPFFYQSQVITSRLTGATNEGLGGVSTLRGVLRNRVVGDGFLYGNFELRWKPWYFTFLKQDWYMGLDAFYDFGVITREIKMPSNLQANFSQLFPADNFSDYFKLENDKLHQDAGISIMFAMNRNFVIAFDLGKAFNAQDGNIGVSIGLNYLF